VWRKLENVCPDSVSTRCVATVNIMLLYINLVRIGAARGRFLTFLVTD
jgi:hypothetical protein